MEFQLVFVLCMGMVVALSASPHHHQTSEPANTDDEEHTNACHDNQTSIVNSINHFGFALSEAIGEPGNMFLSPLGINMALGMAYLGARGNTAQQMEHALAYEASNIKGHQVHECIQHLCEETLQRAIQNGYYSLNIVNALFHQNGSELHQQFVDGIEVHYHANALELDFARNSVESTNTINDWVKEKTENKIEKLFAEPLDPDTKVVLTNAIYFKGKWKIEFPEARSYDGRFYVAENAEWKDTRMMSLAEETFPYYKDTELEYKFMEMPYKGDQVSMLFALPFAYDALPNLQMNEDLLRRIRSQMTETELETVTIPKFKFSYEKKLKVVLSSLGMHDAFDPDTADFSGIGDQGLHISSVVHKAVIEVNEQGSEAAAVSGVVMMPVMAREVTDFRAYHAFLFYIIDKQSGVILFSGKVMDPSETAM